MEKIFATEELILENMMKIFICAFISMNVCEMCLPESKNSADGAVVLGSFR